MVMCMRRQGAFTLVELLVVIAIIAVLVAILMPVIGSVQEKARQGRCMTNMMQITTALRAYKADWEKYPPPPYFDGGTWTYRGGPNALYPDYVSNKANLLCPNDTTLRGIPQSQVPGNYCSYSGVIAGGNDPGVATFWAFASFPDTDVFGNPIIRYYLTYNFGGFDNDGWDESGWANSTWVFKYPPVGPVPNWLAAEGKKWRHYPRLGNPRAPDNTICMRCIHHHRWYGTAPTRWRDPIVRLGGEATTVDYHPWTVVDANGVSQWRVQK